MQVYIIDTKTNLFFQTERKPIQHRIYK